MIHLLSLAVVALICGIPGVLFARLLHGMTLSTWISVLLGSAIIPMAIVVAMAGGSVSQTPYVPWWFPALVLAGGIATGLAYFRRRT